MNKPKLIQLLLLVASAYIAYVFIPKGLSYWTKPCRDYAALIHLPKQYADVMSAFCQTGFLKMIGIFEILGGLLILIPRTRLIGAAIVLPLIFNIFMLHLFVDNRPHELVETGIPLALSIAVLIGDLATRKNVWAFITGKQ